MRSFAFGLIFLAAALISCEQESATTTAAGIVAECGIRVKVVHSFCAFIFLEIQDEQYFHLGDTDWKFADGRDAKSVFMVKNICDFGLELNQNNLLDKEFEVKQVTDYEDRCAVCYGGYGGDLPDKSLIVRVCSDVGE